MTAIIQSVARRGFLAGLAAIVLPGSAALAVAIPDPAPIIGPGPEEYRSNGAPIAPAADEDPALIICGNEMDRLLPIYRDAVEKLVAAVEQFEQLRPALPDELVLTCRHQDWSQFKHYTEQEEDVQGRLVWQDHDPPRNIFSAARLRRGLSECDGRTRLSKRLRRMLDLAERYERNWKKARKAAGVALTLEAKYFAGRDVEAAVENIRLVPAQSPVGLIIKARAIKAYGDVATGRGCDAHMVIGPQFAADVLRLFGPGEWS